MVGVRALQRWTALWGSLHSIRWSDPSPDKPNLFVCSLPFFQIDQVRLQVTTQSLKKVRRNVPSVQAAMELFAI
jgi:hypothetical protein